MKILYGVNRKVFPENKIIAIMPDNHEFSEAEKNEKNFKIIQIDITEDEVIDILSEKNGIISEDEKEIIRKPIEKGKSQYELYVKQMTEISKIQNVEVEIIEKENIKATMLSRTSGIIKDPIKPISPKEIIK